MYDFNEKKIKIELFFSYNLVWITYKKKIKETPNILKKKGENRLCAVTFYP